MSYIFPQHLFPSEKVLIALGSSIGDAEAIFESAEKFLDENGLEIIKKSKNHKFPPYGGVAKNEFTNAVWEIEIQGLKEFSYDKARKFLNLLQKCEDHHGRTREKQWGDRTLDIDILTFGNLECNTTQLTIPHAEIQKRDFVLIPLREIL